MNKQLGTIRSYDRMLKMVAAPLCGRHTAAYSSRLDNLEVSSARGRLESSPTNTDHLPYGSPIVVVSVSA